MDKLTAVTIFADDNIHDYFEQARYLLGVRLDDYYLQMRYSLNQRFHNYKPHFELIHVSVSDAELTALSIFGAYAEHSNDSGG